MRYVSAYMLAILGGHDAPTADDVRRILNSVGVDVDNSELELVMDKLKGKDIESLQEEGRARLQSVFGNPDGPEVVQVKEPEVDPVAKKEDAAPVDTSDDDSDDGGLLNLFD